jgi:ABC-type dipeptide/oligopeptide/nickel transport system ATPase subunit
MITIENLSISYGKGKRVIDSLELTISEGTINGIVGLWCGKTLSQCNVWIKGIETGKIKWNGERKLKKAVSYLH